MPQYRKLHTRTIESFDFNGLADDFARLTWVLLPLVSCKEGRGIDLSSWLISRLYPLRSDITPDMIEAAMRDFETHGMISRYSVAGRRYYQITNWTHYQGDTKKESPSPYPTPELVQSYAGASTELVTQESSTDSIFNIQYSNSYSNASAPTATRPTPPENKNKNGLEPDFKELQEHFAKVTTFQPNAQLGSYERDWRDPLQSILCLTSGDVPAAITLIDNALRIARGQNEQRKVYKVSCPRSIATIAANLAIESGSTAEAVVADTLWKQVKAALVNGYSTAEPRLQSAMKAVGWTTLKDAKEKDEPKLREAVFNAYRNTATV